MKRIWLIKDGETIPLTPQIKRQRTAMLADALIASGHQVVWWTSTHQHLTKSLLYKEDHQECTHRGVIVNYMHAGSYRRNMSLPRILHHRRFAKKLQKAFLREARPDLIVVSYPILEAVHVAITYAKRNGIPVVIDVRDQWPDTFTNYVPPHARWMVRVLVRILYPHAASDLKAATALTSMSSLVLAWALKKAGRIEGSDSAVFYLSTDLDPEALDENGGDKPLLPELTEVSQIVCTYLGTLNNTADLKTLAEAILQFSAQPDAMKYHFVIGGDGDLGPYLKERLRGLQNVTFTGWLDKQQCHRLLRQTDIALLTGKNEAMPNKIFDYIAYGLPIVCSIKGEAPMFIARHGIGAVCASGDADSLMKAIAVLSEPARLKSAREHLTQLPPNLYKADAIYKAFALFLESQG